MIKKIALLLILFCYYFLLKHQQKSLLRWVLNPSTHTVIMIMQLITVRTMAMMMPNGLSTGVLISAGLWFHGYGDFRCHIDNRFAPRDGLVWHIP
ncbi:hypothetical protein [Arsenophonus apicola]|uniref:Inner membrane protein n=1 Tax=Arsenophonus apicola TaxID=2879119 RepID=A0ABY8P276_9GAMM|nr:hypothetical protein [Arsenophonus apicola]WGO83066.1 hypothetical protein QG404_12050 [Arsenophonus apicola]